MLAAVGALPAPVVRVAWPHRRRAECAETWETRDAAKAASKSGMMIDALQLVRTGSKAGGVANAASSARRASARGSAIAKARGVGVKVAPTRTKSGSPSSSRSRARR